MHVWKGGVWPSQQAGNTIFFAWRKEDKSFTVRHWVGLTRASCVNLMHSNMILCLMCVSELDIQLYRIHYYEWSSSASSVTIVCLLNDDGRSKWMMQSTIQFNAECSCWNSNFFQLKTKARSSNGASSCQVDRSQCESIARRDEIMTRRWHRNTSHLYSLFAAALTWTCAELLHLLVLYCSQSPLPTQSNWYNCFFPTRSSLLDFCGSSSRCIWSNLTCANSWKSAGAIIVEVFAYEWEMSRD